MEQEHRITYKAGITRTPSDFLCKDGELAECINLTTDNEELKPMAAYPEDTGAAASLCRISAVVSISCMQSPPVASYNNRLLRFVKG